MADLDHGLGKRSPLWTMATLARRDAGDLVPRVPAKQRSAAPLRMEPLVHSRILPHLLRTTRDTILPPDPSDVISPGDAPYDAARIVAFTDILLARDRRDPLVHLEALLARGAGLDTLYVDLLAPAAAYLGTLWDADECSFSDIALAFCTLHRLVRDLGRRHGGEPAIEPDRRVLLAPVPGNRHTFGLLVVENLFRRSGWTVLAMPAASRGEIVAAVRRDWFAVAGLSLSCDDHAGEVRDLIATIRRASLNPAITVLLGGHHLVDTPDDAVALGADAAASDVRVAIADARRYGEAGRPR